MPVSVIRSGTIFALLTAVGLGAITTLAKIYYAEGGNAMTLMLARFLVSTLLIALLIKYKRKPFKIAQPQLVPVLLVGVVWSGGMIFYLLSVESISVSLAVLILYAYPLLVLIYSIIRKQLPLSPRILLFFGVAFLGLYLALSGGEIVLNTNGIILAGLASLCATYTFISGARVAPLVDPLAMTFWVNAVGLLIIVPLMYQQLVTDVSSTGNLALAAATGFYLIAILSQFQALARLQAATAAFILNLEPIVSILLAVTILGEQLSYLQWGGVILVMTVLLISIQIKTIPNQVDSNT